MAGDFEWAGGSSRQGRGFKMVSSDIPFLWMAASLAPLLLWSWHEGQSWAPRSSCWGGWPGPTAIGN